LQAKETTDSIPLFSTLLFTHPALFLQGRKKSEETSPYLHPEKEWWQLPSHLSLLQNEDFRSKSRHVKNFTAGI
jgi:hypothetical protein